MAVTYQTIFNIYLLFAGLVLLANIVGIVINRVIRRRLRRLERA